LAATTFGFCPNDITGLYNGVLPAAARPDQQYTNLAGDFSGSTPATLTNLHITADVYALGSASTSCPQPSGGGGFCGGEFTTDNYDRASGLGTLTVTGGVYMAHHGPVGQEWEIYDTSGQSSRPYSGYDFTVKFQNLSTLLDAVSTVSGVLTTTTSSSSVWRIISVSVSS
jgi:hypothetical protein